jgi:membrane protein implicated in regulation of membrane protease activity
MGIRLSLHSPREPMETTMSWNAPTLWWLAAGVLVAAELSTGTFYLLMVALGCGAGAIAAHLGLGGTAQLITAALLGGGATAAWHLKRASQPRSAPAASNRDVNLDIGETVRVEAWDEDGLARVHYRGAGWSARFAGSGAPAPGEHMIVAIEGNRLSLAPRN